MQTLYDIFLTNKIGKTISRLEEYNMDVGTVEEHKKLLDTMIRKRFHIQYILFILCSNPGEKAYELLKYIHHTYHPDLNMLIDTYEIDSAKFQENATHVAAAFANVLHALRPERVPENMVVNIIEGKHILSLYINTTSG